MQKIHLYGNNGNWPFVITRSHSCVNIQHSITFSMKLKASMFAESCKQRAQLTFISEDPVNFFSGTKLSEATPGDLDEK